MAGRERCRFLERLGMHGYANKLQGPNVLDTAGVPDFCGGFEPMAQVGEVFASTGFSLPAAS
jgi:hypothetical protein